MTTTRRWLLPGSLVLAACLAAGCSSLPTAPSNDAGDLSLVATARTAAPAAAAPPSFRPGSVTTTSATNRVHGDQGGTVHGGQFTVVIPPGAFSGQATITVSQPDPADPRVDLSIWPASKNTFRVPVTLIAHLSNATTRQIAGSQVRELDPVSGGWMPVTGQTTDLPSKSVRAPLVHFSSYRVDLPAATDSPSWRPPVRGR